MHLTTRVSRLRQAGFSLVELMVGLAIGMLATIIIIQVMSVFEAQRRTTTGSADAQTNGGIALYTIAREAHMAGYPLLPSTDSPLECTTLNIRSGAAGIAADLSPITITNGVATGSVSASDSITIRYGNSEMGGANTQISAVAGAVATVGTSLGCKVNDISLVNTGPVCDMSKVTAVTGAGVTPATVTLTDANGIAGNANLACLGSWTEVTYAVDQASGNLNRTFKVNGVAITTTPTSVVGVVNLHAQYGISATANSNQVTQWVDAKVDATSGIDWSAPSLANRNRIKAIRVAVVARNAKIEPAAVSALCSSTTAAAPTGLCAWAGTAGSPAPAVDLSPADANWARYRYRVFETIIPLRNVIWSKDTL